MKAGHILGSLALAGVMLAAPGAEAKQIPGRARNALMKATVQSLRQDAGGSGAGGSPSRPSFATVSTGGFGGTSMPGLTSDVSTNVGSPTLLGNTGRVEIVVRATDIITVVR